jgi:hypothetical protein
MIDLAATTFAYARKSPFEASGLILAVMEYSLEGELLASSSAHDAMAAEFASDGLSATSALAFADPEDDLFLDTVKREFPGFRYVVMGKVGVLSKSLVAQKHRIVVEGELSLIDLVGEPKSIRSSGPIVMEGSGDTERGARDDAFKRFGVTAASVMKNLLYP